MNIRSSSRPPFVIIRLEETKTDTLLIWNFTIGCIFCFMDTTSQQMSTARLARSCKLHQISQHRTIRCARSRCCCMYILIINISNACPFLIVTPLYFNQCILTEESCSFIEDVCTDVKNKQMYTFKGRRTAAASLDNMQKLRVVLKKVPQ